MGSVGGHTHDRDHGSRGAANPGAQDLRPAGEGDDAIHFVVDGRCKSFFFAFPEPWRRFETRSRRSPKGWTPPLREYRRALRPKTKWSRAACLPRSAESFSKIRTGRQGLAGSPGFWPSAKLCLWSLDLRPGDHARRDAPNRWRCPVLSQCHGELWVACPCSWPCIVPGPRPVVADSVELTQIQPALDTLT